MDKPAMVFLDRFVLELRWKLFWRSIIFFELWSLFIIFSDKRVLVERLLHLFFISWNLDAKPLLLSFRRDLPAFIDIPGETMKTRVSEYSKRPTVYSMVAHPMSIASIAAKVIKAETKIALNTDVNGRFSLFNPNPECQNLRPNLIWTEKNQILGQWILRIQLPKILIFHCLLYPHQFL